MSINNHYFLHLQSKKCNMRDAIISHKNNYKIAS